jgi:hypothetical protein
MKRGKPRNALVLAVWLGVLALCAGPAPPHQREESEKDLYPSVVKHLPAIDTVEISRIPLVADDPVILTGQEAQTIAQAWRRLRRGAGMQCFGPGYTIRFKSAGKVLVEAQVCFDCENILTPATSIASIGGNRMAYRAFKRLVTTAAPYPARPLSSDARPLRLPLLNTQN